MPKSSVSVVPIGKKKCRPFLLEVMVLSPESGFKFQVLVERACTPEAEAIWKLVFDLYKTDGGQEQQLVHVSFTAGSPVEQASVQRLVTEGVTPAQTDLLVNKVHPTVKKLAGKKKVKPEEKQAVHDSMAEVLTVET